MLHYYRRSLLIAVLAMLTNMACHAQRLLDKPVNVEARNRHIKDVLDIIGKRSGFSFSYNSDVVPADSLVTLTATYRPLHEVLHMIFGDRFQYKEVDNHIVILPAEKEKWFTISGYITDAITGIKIADVSVFERQQLASTLTNEDGFFRLRLKDKGRYAIAEITVSKGGFYIDTSVNMLQGIDQELSLRLTPSSYTLPDVMITQYTGVEKSWFGKFLFSSRLRKQSANLGKFFVDKPVQASFLPGLGSHGKLSGQVTNKFSFNVLGGYAAGVNGFELGGLFNIDKKDVKYAQIGGIFNIVSGGVTGVQIGGIANKVSADMNGLQISGIASKVSGNTEGLVIAGICSRVSGNMKGMQIAGIVNFVAKKDSTTDKHYETDTTNTMKGMQLAGIANIVNNKSRGFQLAGIANISRGGMSGLQMSGILNKTKTLEGSQIGLINIADTVTGYSIGLINIVKKGYHALAVSTNDMTNVNVAYKAGGNKKLYSILTLGINIAADKKAYASGMGIGTEHATGKKTGIATELTVLSLNEGDKNGDMLLIKLEPIFNWNISRKFTLYTGPSISFIPNTPATGETGYLHGVPTAALYDFKTGYNMLTWVGWQVGFHIF